MRHPTVPARLPVPVATAVAPHRPKRARLARGPHRPGHPLPRPAAARPPGRSCPGAGPRRAPAPRGRVVSSSRRSAVVPLDRDRLRSRRPTRTAPRTTAKQNCTSSRGVTGGIPDRRAAGGRCGGLDRQGRRRVIARAFRLGRRRHADRCRRAVGGIAGALPMSHGSRNCRRRRCREGVAAPSGRAAQLASSGCSDAPTSGVWPRLDRGRPRTTSTGRVPTARQAPIAAARMVAPVERPVHAGPRPQEAGAVAGPSVPDIAPALRDGRRVGRHADRCCRARSDRTRACGTERGRATAGRRALRRRLPTGRGDPQRPATGTVAP